MKKTLLPILILIIVISCCACSLETDKNNSSKEQSNTTSLSDVEIARQEVIDKWEKEAGVLGTSKFIEDTYKKYPTDTIISNIYYYCIAKEQYDYYKQFSYNEDYLTTAKEYAAKIDPDYSGKFSDEMHKFVDTLIPKETIEEEHKKAETQQDSYNSLTNSDKKAICKYIQSRYDYYDKINGGYSGDKYSDTIMQEAANKYNLTVSQIKVIWMNSYSY